MNDADEGFGIADMELSDKVVAVVDDKNVDSSEIDSGESSRIKDRFGFFLDKSSRNFNHSKEIDKKENFARRSKDNERAKKWLFMTKAWHEDYSTNANSLNMINSLPAKKAKLFGAIPLPSVPKLGLANLVDPYSISKLKSRVRKGVPEPLRSYVWHHLSDSDRAKELFPTPSTELMPSTLPGQVTDEVCTCVIVIVHTHILQSASFH